MFYVLLILVVTICFLTALSLTDYKFKFNNIKKDVFDLLNEFEKYPKLREQVIRNSQIAILAVLLMMIMEILDGVFIQIPSMAFWVLTMVSLIIFLYLLKKDKIKEVKKK